MFIVIKCIRTNNVINNVGINNTSPNLTLDVGSTNVNHNIGRAILTAGNIYNADKLDFFEYWKMGW